MSAIEAAIEKVKSLNEDQARELLGWLEFHNTPIIEKKKPLGAKAMVGFARRFRKEPRTPESWLGEPRAGER